MCLCRLVLPNLTVNGIVRISDWYFSPQIIENGKNMEYLVRGLFTQAGTRSGDSFHPEVSEYLMRGPNKYGGDVVAIDIQRSRDHALATYNDLRELCGLRRATNWDGFLDVIKPERINLLKSIYHSHEDVDLKVGGSLENRDFESLFGHTFTCIIAKQFKKVRTADRFFYENGMVEFTPGRHPNLHFIFEILIV